MRFNFLVCLQESEDVVEDLENNEVAYSSAVFSSDLCADSVHRLKLNEGAELIHHIYRL